MRKLNKTWMRVIAIFILIVVAFTLSSCDKTSKPVITLRLYLPCDSINYSVVSDFEKQYGIKVIYETYSNNEIMYKKIKASPDDYDIIIPTDYMISRLINENMLLKLNKDKIPNWEFIDSAYQKMYFDPTGEYAVPYVTGTLGILYNKDLVGQPVTSWGSLWEEKYNDQILMPDSSRDALTVSLKHLGYSANASSPAELEAAKQKLIEQSRLVQYHTLNEIADIMLMGKMAIGVTYSGEAYNAIRRSKNAELDFVIPREGASRWVNAMVVLKSTPHFDEAMLFINYLCENYAAITNQEEIRRTSAQKNVRGLISDEISASPVLYPSAETLANCEYIRYNPSINSIYDAVWMDVLRTR